MNILIMGGNGFLGSQLLIDLQNKFSGVNVFVSTSRKSPHQEGVIYVDYESIKSINNLLSQSSPNFILHLASNCIRDQSNKSLIEGQTRDNNILTALCQLEFQPKLIFVASMAVFDARDKEIGPEKYSPKSNYGLEKMYMINRLTNSADPSHLDWKVVYPSSIYGKGQTGRMFLPTLLQHIQEGTVMNAKGSMKKRDFIHVKDVTRSLVRLISGYEKYSDKHIFLHSGSLMRLGDVASNICKLLKLDMTRTIRFQDTLTDIDDFQVVMDRYCSLDDFPVDIPFCDGIQEMFIER